VARGKKTGGRSFAKGNPGRPKGSHDKIPRTVKASVKAIFEKLAVEDRDAWERALKRTMRKGGAVAFPYYNLAAAYIDGKPVTRVQVEEVQSIVIEVPPGCDLDDEMGKAPGKSEKSETED
jgi:hypothetical protein